MAIGGMMVFHPSANAQPQNYNNNTDSVKTTTQRPQQITLKKLKKMFPQAYRDKNANPEVWKQNQNMYVAEVNGKISLVGKIAASSGQNPWDALVKKYCYSENKTFSLSDFGI